jgi:WD40 repeat protein
MLATSSDDGTVKIWALGSSGKFECQATLTCASFVYSMVFSPDALLIAAGCCGGKLLLIDSVAGRVKASVSGHAAAINCVCFDPSGKFVASCSVDKTVRLWHAATGTPCSSLAPPSPGRDR